MNFYQTSLDVKLHLRKDLFEAMMADPQAMEIYQYFHRDAGILI